MAGAGSLQVARYAAQQARRLSDEHQREHRDADPSNKSIARRGDDLRRLAGEAAVNMDVVERAERGARTLRLRAAAVAADAGLQARLRAEAHARREEAARGGSIPPHRTRKFR